MRKKGYIVIQALVFGAIGVLLFGALAGWAKINITASRQLVLRERAFQIAEAGVEYYRWHLAHSPEDYQDGTGGPGPYEHEYEDKDGNSVGAFTLTITPPPVGSTVVTVLSEGRVDEDPSISRKIEAKLAIPSIAKYAFLANSAMRFGSGTEVFGPMHSNDGVRFDGLAHNIITSSRSDYDDPDHSGANEFGVHTHVSPVDPTPPTAVPTRNDVFMAGRQFPMPAVDFAGFTNDLSQMKTEAQGDGSYFGSSGALGYRVVLKTSDQFDLYRVNSLQSPPNPPGSRNCTNVGGQTGWGTWSISGQTLLGTHPLPAGGVIFLEDNVWVDGQINSARVTIASGRFPENPNTNTSITINDDLTYTNYGGQDVIALIAQNNVNIGLFSQDDLKIDAALVAKNGRVGRFYYENDCYTTSNWYIRQTISLFGMIASNLRYGFAYTDGTGYQIRNIVYDANLLYSPPPAFPLTSDQYSTISWREVP